MCNKGAKSLGSDETPIHDGLSEFGSVVRALQDIKFRWFVMTSLQCLYIWGVHQCDAERLFTVVALSSRENMNCASASLHLHIEGNT